jgi:PAS domain S-box-containing protein
MNSIKRWLAPPVFKGDEEKTRQASLINLIVVATLALMLILVVGSLVAGNTPIRILVIDLFLGWAITLLVRRWLHRGRVTLARHGIIVFGFVFLIWVIASIGTIRGPTAALFVFWVLMTGLLFGRRGILIGAPVASLAILGLIVAENAMWLRQPFQGVGLSQWITFTTLFGFTGGLTNYVMQRTQVALTRAEYEIEQRKQVEAALKDSEQRYRTLVEWTPEPLAVHRNRTLVYVNPACAELFGAASAQEVIGTSILNRIHPNHIESALQREQYFLKHGATPRAQQKFIKMDGTPIDVEVQSTSILYDGMPAVHAVLRDVTDRIAIEVELKVAKSKAENASRAKSRFLASASHDLRQPAHALGMFVARLSKMPNNAQTAQLVAGLETSVSTMQDMLDRFFDISRLDEEGTEITTGVFPIEGIFNQLRLSFSNVASDKGLRLRLRPSPAWVRSEPNLLHRILLNLVGNAIRYTQHGTVLVAARPTRDGTQLRIEVRDSGIGIDAQHHDEIFQEFFQVDNPQRDRAKGFGVGLNIVARACRLLNHPLSIRSALGCGTCFSVLVPIAPPAHSQAESLPDDATTMGELDGLSILLIEDDVLVTAGLSALLKAWGCKVAVANNARMACEMARQGKVCDIIVSDFRLGGGDNGIDAIRMLREIASQQTAACLMTGDTDPQIKKQAQAAGITLLLKPVRPAKLRSLLRRLMAEDQSDRADLT